MANKKYKIRNRKRKFHGKQYTTPVTYQFTAAHNVTQTVNNDEINCSTGKRELQKHASCQYCGAGLQLSHNEMKNIEFLLSFSIICKDCGFEINFSLPQILNKTS